MNTSAIASDVTAVDPNSFKLDLDPEFFSQLESGSKKSEKSFYCGQKIVSLKK